MDEPHAYRIETFDALLRDLVTWGLVARTDIDGVPSWELTDNAQSRLQEIIRPGDPPPADKLVYLDHSCADCRTHGRTRLFEGVYLCDTCMARRTTEVTAPSPARRRWPWSHRHDKNGSVPSE